jgi:4-hydroxy-tetrahydrodipicolinate reductase
MINVIVAGAAGRMGSRLVTLIKDSTTLTLAGAIEEKGHPAVGGDAGETAGCGRGGILITLKRLCIICGRQRNISELW